MHRSFACFGVEETSCIIHWWCARTKFHFRGEYLNSLHASLAAENCDVFVAQLLMLRTQQYEYLFLQSQYGRTSDPKTFRVPRLSFAQWVLLFLSWPDDPQFQRSNPLTTLPITPKALATDKRFQLVPASPLSRRYHFLLDFVFPVQLLRAKTQDRKLA